MGTLQDDIYCITCTQASGLVYDVTEGLGIKTRRLRRDRSLRRLEKDTRNHLPFLYNICMFLFSLPPTPAVVLRKNRDCTVESVLFFLQFVA